MSDITITIGSLGALNTLKLVEDRLDEIDRLQIENPELPMRDQQTVNEYRRVKDELLAALVPTGLVNC